MELDRYLAISIEQADRGEYISLAELKKEIDEKFENGYYTKTPLVDSDKIADAMKSLDPAIIKDNMLKELEEEMLGCITTPLLIMLRKTGREEGVAIGEAKGMENLLSLLDLLY